MLNISLQLPLSFHSDSIKNRQFSTAEKYYDDFVFNVPFNIILVISRRWKGDNERFCAMKCRTVMSWISPPAGFEPGTSWSEVGSANHSPNAETSHKYFNVIIYCK